MLTHAISSMLPRSQDLKDEQRKMGALKCIGLVERPPLEFCLECAKPEESTPIFIFFLHLRLQLDIHTWSEAMVGLPWIVLVVTKNSLLWIFNYSSQLEQINRIHGIYNSMALLH